MTLTKARDSRKVSEVLGRVYVMGAHAKNAEDSNVEPNSREENSLFIPAPGRERRGAEPCDEYFSNCVPSILARWIGSNLRRQTSPSVQPLPPVRRGQLGITFGGHATSLLRYAHADILCDPMLGSRLGIQKRHAAPGLRVETMPTMDLILISSLRRDHCHPSTLRAISDHSRSTTMILGPKGIVQSLAFLHLRNIHECDPGDVIDVAGLRVFAYGNKDCLPGISFVIEDARRRAPRIFYCGAGGYFSGFKTVGMDHDVDIAFLPSGGYAPSSLQTYNLSPEDAVQAFLDIKAKTLVPIRRHGFTLSYETVDDADSWFEHLARQYALKSHFCLLKPGESRIFVKNQS